MKDYKTWWRKEIDKLDDIPFCVADFEDLDTWDCLSEQGWAIREGLA